MASVLKSGTKADLRVRREPPSTITRKGSRDGEVIVSVSRQIQTLDQLLEAASIDTKLWDVDRWEANKWESGMKIKLPDGDRLREYVVVQPLWQVKAWFKRKTPQVRAAEELLESIEKGARIPPRIRPRKSQKRGIRRSLEVSIMDPHIGLVTQMPEGDAPWNLDLAAETIMIAFQDLIRKASTLGPFEEIFMPFGNDFVHVDNIAHTTTAGTNQPESESWHKVFVYAERVAIAMVEEARKAAPKVHIYEIPGNHSRQSDFALARVLKAYFAKAKDVVVDASSSPYKFHRYGVTLVGFEHGHSVSPIRLAALMANERKQDWMETEYREWHLGDQHRKGSSKPSMLEEQGVSVEYIPGLTAPNEWHRLKSFSHQKRGAMAYVYDHGTGPIARFQFNISQYSHKPMVPR